VNQGHKNNTEEIQDKYSVARQKMRGQTPEKIKLMEPKQNLKKRQKRRAAPS